MSRMPQQAPLCIEVVAPRVGALRLIVRFGRAAAVVAGLALLGASICALALGLHPGWPFLLALAAPIAGFAIWLATEICELLHDTLVPR